MTSRLRDVYSIDGRLSLILGLSVAAHLGIAVYAWMTDVETPPPAQAAQPADYRQETISIVDPQFLAPLPGIGMPATPSTQTPDPIVLRPRRENAPVTMSAAEARAMAAILTSGSEQRRAPGRELEGQIAARRTTEIGSRAGFRSEPSLHIGETGGGPTIDDPTSPTHREVKAEGHAPGRIQIKPLRTGPEDTTLTVDGVLAKISSAYMSGLARCYAKGLTTDTSLAGKIAMSFEVTAHGALDEVSARGVSSAVDGCVQTLMSGWHFAIPRDKDGTATEANFQISLQLTPN